MGNLFKEILSLSLSGTLLILLILVMNPILRERFSKAWQYYIWIVVLIRLLVPFSPEFGIVDNLFRPLSAENSSALLPPAESVDLHTETGNPENMQGDTKGNAQSTDPDEKNHTIIESKENAIYSDGWKIGGYLWLAGMILLFFGKQAGYGHFLRLMHRSSEPVADKRILQIYKEAAKELEIQKVPKLKYSTRIASPMLTGLIKPAIYLTDTTIQWDDKSLHYVLLHELVHYKRHDLWYKWCSDLVLCIHWFNPMIYIMNRHMNAQCEISCDEAVARDLNTEEKLAYGNVLLNAVSENMKSHRPMLSSALYEDKKSMKERIKAIIMSKRKSKKSVLLSAVITLTLCFAAFWLGAYTKNSGNINGSKVNAANEQNTVNEDTVNEGTNTAAGNSAEPAAESQNTQSSDEKSEDTAADTDSQADSGNTLPGSSSSSESNNTESAPDTAQAADSTGTSSVSDTLTYSNKDFGFDFTLPSTWEGYSIENTTWQGSALTGEHTGEITEQGTKIIIRHPDWTEKNPRQDIPVMVFTKEQWKLVEKEELAVSAAPIGPSKLGSNSEYVFALPARYNFSFDTGYEEVEDIMENNPLTPTENIQ